MKDILKKYKKKKNIQNIGLVVASLALAIGINTFVFNDTNVGEKLKTNVNEALVNEEKSDLYIEQNDDMFSINVGENMENVENISFSITYNPETVKIENMKGDNSNIDLMNLSNHPGVNTIVLNLEQADDIKKGEEIINFKIIKSGEVPESVNIISANFTDSEGETYLLSTSGVDL